MTKFCHLGSWRQNAKTQFSQNLSNLALVSIDDPMTHYWIPEIQDGWDPPSWKSTWRHFLSADSGAIWITFRRLVQNDVKCGDVVEIETRCRIPIWRTFGRIQWHVIPEPHITLQGAATWWIHCRDSRATCHITIKMQSPGETSVMIVPHCRV